MLRLASLASLAVLALAACAAAPEPQGTSRDDDEINGSSKDDEETVKAKREEAGETGETDETSKGEGRTFTNPVLASDCPDPGVVAAAEDSFYMVCTGGPFRIRHSKDLVTWTDTGKSIFPSGKPPWARDGNRDWAPEIHRLAPDSYVAYYTAADAAGRLAIGVASATSPEGPYSDLGRPLVQHDIGAIDAHFFADDDGRKYLYWKVDGNQLAGGRTPIMGRELARDGRSFKPGSVAVEVLSNSPASWEGPLVEAPWVVKREGRYYLFYSADVYDERYETGVARASSPLARYTRRPGPILKNNERWVGPGHGAVVTKGGADWFVHHAWPTGSEGKIARDKGRHVVLDRIVWKDGWPGFEGASTSFAEQAAP